MIAKRISLLAILVVMGLVPVLRADNKCSAATMNGAYGFSGNGFEIVRQPVSRSGGKSNGRLSSQSFSPVVFVGTLAFSVDETLSGSFTANGNGHQDTAVPFAGAYVVNADCTGMVAVTEKDGRESHFALTITDGGKEVLAIQTDAGAERTFVLRKQ